MGRQQLRKQVITIIIYNDNNNDSNNGNDSSNSNSSSLGVLQIIIHESQNRSLSQRQPSI